MIGFNGCANDTFDLSSDHELSVVKMTFWTIFISPPICLTWVVVEKKGENKILNMSGVLVVEGLCHDLIYRAVWAYILTPR